MDSTIYPNRLNILIVDDEANIRRTLTIYLESANHRVIAVNNVKDALYQAEHEKFDMAFVDLRLGTDSGLELLTSLLAKCTWMKIVVITAYASIETAIDAIRRGATDYISKPFTPEQVEIAVNRIVNIQSMEQRIEILKQDLDRLHPEISFSSEHASTQRAVELARQVAISEAIVLLRGPSGTGKSVLAGAIHKWSHRANKPFGVISCPTLTQDLLESELFGHVRGAFTGALRDNPGRITHCEGGTIFLDEIGDLPISIQPKLLRFIQDKEYEQVGGQKTFKADVRIIVATNSDLAKAVNENRFREDLYYRLNVVPIDLPPLSERPNDIINLATSMLNFFGSQNHKYIKGFTDNAEYALRNYTWPGNIRELRNVIERAAIFCHSELVDIEHLPETISLNERPVTLGDQVSLETIEENHIRRVLASTKSLQEAADILGIDQATLWRKRKQYGI